MVQFEPPFLHVPSFHLPTFPVMLVLEPPVFLCSFPLPLPPGPHVTAAVIGTTLSSTLPPLVNSELFIQANVRCRGPAYHLLSNSCTRILCREPQVRNSLRGPSRSVRTHEVHQSGRPPPAGVLPLLTSLQPQSDNLCFLSGDAQPSSSLHPALITRGFCTDLDFAFFESLPRASPSIPFFEPRSQCLLLPTSTHS